MANTSNTAPLSAKRMLSVTRIYRTSNKETCAQKMKPGARASFIFSGLCFAILFSSILFCGYCYDRSAYLSPDPSSPSWDDDGFPLVDWSYWQRINPDVIGWITIPDTPLNYPIVQAPPEEPDYYLTHDVYRTWNFAGCPYLDAGCKEDGLEQSMNALVFAHNLGHGDTSLFATVARFNNGEFAKLHRSILVQTPKTKQVYVVEASACIPGNQTTKRTSFSDDNDYRAWLSQRIEECSIVLDGNVVDAKRTLTLCTCSYNIWGDERTLAYAVPIDEKMSP